VAQVAAGDQRAIATLYDRYGSALYALAYRIVGQRADAEEVIVEAFTQVWRDANKFDAGRGSVAAWLTTIARSRALDFMRARTRRDKATESAAQDQTDASPTMGSWQNDPGDSVEQTERRHHVRLALEMLSPSQRQAIELAYFDGLSQSEIAERLGEPLGTVKTRIRLGLHKLRDALRPFFFETGP
jgi:RNA polymerase sigma-70 factor (ECF subfamily)